MKIFVHVTSSVVAQFTNNLDLFPPDTPYIRLIDNLLSWGSTSLMGVERDKLETTYFVAFSNAFRFQSKWAAENGVAYSQDTWETDILAAQIRQFEPDVIYTVDPKWFARHSAQLPSVDLNVAWRAAPIEPTANYSCFDLGLSYAPVYLDLLQEHGVPNVEKMDFCFDPRIKYQLEEQLAHKTIDICFVGRYSPMFERRNRLLRDVHREFSRSNRLIFHLLVARRIKGLIPMVPWRMLPVYRQPVFLDELLQVFASSKIVLNCHSDIAGQYKGNMRVFEALGSGSLMLSDVGVYPANLKDGRDFVSYSSNEDLIDKIGYFLKYDDEREAIAKQGYETLSKHYSTMMASKRLQGIFEKYLA